MSSLALVSLLWAGAAIAAPGGLGPPDPKTDSGEAISQLYWIVVVVCAVVFVAVEAALVLFILGMAIAAAGIWFFIRGGHHAEAAP